MLALSAYAVIFLIFVRMVRRWPSTALGPFLCTFGIEQWIQGICPFTVRHPWITNTGMATLVLIGLITRAHRTRIRFTLGYPTLMLVVSLFGLAFCSLTWSPYTDLALEQCYKTIPYLAVAIFVCPLLITTANDLELAMKATFFVGAATVVLILVTGSWIHEGRSHLVLGDGELRGNPLAIAEFSGFVAILGVILRPRWRSSNLRFVRWLAVFLAFCLSAISGSRGQFLGALTAVVLVVNLGQANTNEKQLIVRWIVCGIVLLTGFAVLQTFQDDGFRWQWSEMKYHVISGRIAPSLELLQAWQRGNILVWLFGLGNSASFDVVGCYPHCVPAEILGEEGIIGFALFVTLLYVMITNVFCTRRAWHAAPEAVHAVMALTGLLIYVVLLSLKQGSLLGQPLMFAFAIILARVHGQTVFALRKTAGVHRANSILTVH